MGSRQLSVRAAQAFVALTSLATLLWPLTPSSARAGGCAVIGGYQPDFITPRGANIPSDGGVLVGHQYATNPQPFMPLRLYPADDQGHPANVPTPARKIDLAPGWAVHIPRRPPTGPVRAVMGHMNAEYRFDESSRRRPPARPRNPRVIDETLRPTLGSRGRGGSSPVGRAVNTVRLGRAPARAYGLAVVPVGQSASQRGFAIAINARQRLFRYSSDRGRCQPAAPGNMMSAGEEVEVFFFDLFGRTSPRVRVTVREGRRGSGGGGGAF